MSDLFTAIGLIFFLEGLLIAIFPSRVKNMLEMIKNTPESKLRFSGIIFLVIGFLIIWYIKK
ncbi:MAG: ubiquitin-binding protein [Pelagibacteraceae bacterium]|nr:ubiquitin-binding protein [Pelagibacteraceae bacterium]|tara:strand:+ start:5065 stop:5250 length:186 start_codon:yes stop_codon:yes gene_type:complete